METAPSAPALFVALREPGPSANLKKDEHCSAFNRLVEQSRIPSYVPHSISLAKNVMNLTAAELSASSAERRELVERNRDINVVALNNGKFRIEQPKWSSYLVGAAHALARGAPLYFVERFPSCGRFRLALDLDYYASQLLRHEEQIMLARRVQADVRVCLPSAPMEAVGCRVLYAEPAASAKGVKHGLHLHFPSLPFTCAEASKLAQHLAAQAEVHSPRSAELPPWSHVFDASIFKGGGLRMPYMHKAHAFTSKHRGVVCTTCNKTHTQYTNKDGTLGYGPADDGRPYRLLAMLDGDGKRDLEAEAERYSCAPAPSETHACPPFTRPESIAMLLHDCTLYCSDAEQSSPFKLEIPTAAAAEPQRKPKSRSKAATKPAAAAKSGLGSDLVETPADGAAAAGSRRSLPMSSLGPHTTVYLQQLGQELEVDIDLDLERATVYASTLGSAMVLSIFAHSVRGCVSSSHTHGSNRQLVRFHVKPEFSTVVAQCLDPLCPTSKNCIIPPAVAAEVLAVVTCCLPGAALCTDATAASAKRARCEDGEPSRAPKAKRLHRLGVAATKPATADASPADMRRACHPGSSPDRHSSGQPTDHFEAHAFASGAEDKVLSTPHADTGLRLRDDTHIAGSAMLDHGVCESDLPIGLSGRFCDSIHTERVNTRYLQDGTIVRLWDAAPQVRGLPRSTAVIRSPMDTGKTTVTIKLLNNLQSRSAATPLRVLWVSCRRSLTMQTFSKLHAAGVAVELYDSSLGAVAASAGSRSSSVDGGANILVDSEPPMNASDSAIGDEVLQLLAAAHEGSALTTAAIRPSVHVVQVESLHRCARLGYDAVVIDEAIVVLEQLACAETNKSVQMPNYMAFERVVRSAPAVLILDAGANDHVLATLVHELRPPSAEMPAYLLLNVYQPPVEQRLTVTVIRPATQRLGAAGDASSSTPAHLPANLWMQRILSALAEGNKVVAPSTFKRCVDTLIAVIRDPAVRRLFNLPDGDKWFLVYTSDQSKSEGTRRQLADIEAAWGDERIRLVVFSPTITVGVDCQAAFDVCIGYVGRGGCPPRSFVQMLRRVRNLTSKKIDIIDDCGGESKLPAPTMDGTLALLRSQHAMLSQAAAPMAGIHVGSSQLPLLNQAFVEAERLAAATAARWQLYCMLQSAGFKITVSESAIEDTAAAQLQQLMAAGDMGSTSELPLLEHRVTSAPSPLARQMLSATLSDAASTCHAQMQLRFQLTTRYGLSNPIVPLRSSVPSGTKRFVVPSYALPCGTYAICASRRRAASRMTLPQASLSTCRAAHSYNW